MNILIATPSARPALTGNATTADRWARGLRARGHSVTVLEVPAEWGEADFERALPEADVVHLLHAWKCGRFVEVARARARVVVSFAGTDLSPDLDSALRAIVRHACERANVLVAAGDDPRPQVERVLPECAASVLPVPKGVRPGSGKFAIRKSADELLVVLPANVRAVKRPRFPIDALETLRGEGLDVRYVVLGPVLEAAEGAALDRALAARSWCARVVVPPDAMGDALSQADLVLNCSEIEGFSNALAEAMTVGGCVLASDVPGNRAALGSSGVLYADARDFLEKARRLLRSAEERKRLGEAARADARVRFDPEREIDALLAAYAKALA